MKYLIALFVVTIALTLCVISCEADDDDDDDDTADDDDQDDDDTDDDDDDDDQERELALDDGSAESCLCAVTEYTALFANLFDSNGQADLLSVRLLFNRDFDPQPDPPPPVNLYVWNATASDGPVGAPIFAEEVSAAKWDEWAEIELNETVLVGSQPSMPLFAVGFGPDENGDESCIGEDKNNSGEWGKGWDDEEWGQASSGVLMIRAIIEQ